jgi:hypothetical protein
VTTTKDAFDGRTALVAERGGVALAADVTDVTGLVLP